MTEWGLSMPKSMNLSSFAIISAVPVLAASLAMGYFVGVKLQTNSVPMHPVESIAAASEPETKCTPKLAVDFAAYVSSLMFDFDSENMEESHKLADRWMTATTEMPLRKTLWNPSETRFSNASYVIIGCFHEGVDKSGAHIVRIVGDFQNKSTGEHFVRMDCLYKIAWKGTGLRVLDLIVSPGPVESYFVAGKATHYKGYFEKQD